MCKLLLSECFLGVIVFVKVKYFIKVQGQKGAAGQRRGELGGFCWFLTRDLDDKVIFDVMDGIV